jgi:hypothetical protein
MLSLVAKGGSYATDAVAMAGFDYSTFRVREDIQAALRYAAGSLAHEETVILGNG